MKLRTKISLVIGTLVVVLLVSVGACVYVFGAKELRTVAADNMMTSASLTSKAIGSQLGNYLDAVTILGQDEKLSSEEYTTAQQKAFIDEYTSQYGFTSGNLLNERGISKFDDTDFSDRDYVKRAMAGESNVSDVTLSKYTGTYGVSIAAPVMAAGRKAGVVYFRLDTDFMKEIIADINVSASSYAYILDGEGNIIVHINEDLIMNEAATSAISGAIAQVLASENGQTQYLYNGVPTIVGYAAIPNTNGWKVVIAAPVADSDLSVYNMTKPLVIIDIAAIVIAVLMAIFVANGIAASVGRVQKALVAVAEGDLTVSVPTTKKKDELGVLQNATSQLLSTLSEIIGETGLILEGMSNCDLSMADMGHYPGEFETLSQSVNKIKGILNQLVREIHDSSRCVNEGSDQLASATAVLSQGALSQASSIAQLEMDMQDISDMINHTSENENIVNEQLGSLDQEIQGSNVQMKELQQVVDEITAMTSDISKIVSTIDAIAFQTNILALNASVEAARAGDSGKGFAVVADEVRALAAKSAESSKATAELIDKCIQGIDNAKSCVDSTFGSLSSIVENSATISTAFADITADTAEEAAKSTQVLQEVNKISDVVQSNTAMAEQTAASTSELSEQARLLEKAIARFRL